VIVDNQGAWRDTPTQGYNTDNVALCIPVLLRVVDCRPELTLSLFLHLSQPTHFHLSLLVSLSHRALFATFTLSVYFSVHTFSPISIPIPSKLAYPSTRLRVSTYHFQPTTTKQQNGSIHPLWYDPRSNG